MAASRKLHGDLPLGNPPPSEVATPRSDRSRFQGARRLTWTSPQAPALSAGLKKVEKGGCPTLSSRWACPGRGSAKTHDRRWCSLASAHRRRHNPRRENYLVTGEYCAMRTAKRRHIRSHKHSINRSCAHPYLSFQRNSTLQHHGTIEIIALGAENCVCMFEPANDQRNVRGARHQFFYVQIFYHPQIVLTITRRARRESCAHRPLTASDLAL
jgi:hypothetical protein